MEWTRSETLALAMHSCTSCQGMGLIKLKRPDKYSPCNCVFRAIFRTCFDHFRLCAAHDKPPVTASLEYSPNSNLRQTYGLKEEEYVADFLNLSKRALSADQYRIFRMHLLLGADWKLCCRKFNMDRGDFFHEVYRIQQRLGRRYREVKPYALFPLDEYFAGVIHKHNTPTIAEAVAELAELEGAEGYANAGNGD